MTPLYKIQDLSIHFEDNLLNPIGKKRINKAVDNVNFEIYRGETLGLVGESGSGKSTLGKALIKLIQPTNGFIHFNGNEITNISNENLRNIRQHFQIIFQDPFSSLNPRKTVKQILSEPFIIHFCKMPKQEIVENALNLLDLVGLSGKDINRYPHQFSGGQRQRIGIARALALKPEFVVCDEPVSSLDVSVQAQIINLLLDLQKKMNLTYLFISHDLSVVKKVSKRIAVMYLGKIVEISSKDTIYTNAKHPYTKALLSAIPTPNPRSEKKRKSNKIIIEGELPSPFDPPEGCNFSTRCYLKEKVKNELKIDCNNTDVELNKLGSNHSVGCHLYNHK